jgi:hypothetical protein
MGIKLGYSVSSTSKNPDDLLRKLKKLAEQQTDVIELGLTREEKFQHKFTKEIVKYIRQFKYRSIHTPILDLELKPLRYPSKAAKRLLKIIDNLAADIDPSVVLFHPNIVGDFDYLNKRYGSLVAFENMDSRKDFGKTVEDMKKVFKKSPMAKWVFDVNHLYTNDSSMKSARLFYKAFGDKLVSYHISSLGDRHDCFCRTHEDVILTAVTDLSKPMVHEGNVLEKNLLHEEENYIKKFFLRK